jgi:hypothetical protein
MKRLSILLAAVLLAACATTNKPGIEKPGYIAVLEKKGVPAATVTRIADGRVLGYGDIKSLVVAGIPGSMTVPYLKATRAPYDFSMTQINGLVDAGADDSLINYLGKAKGVYLEDDDNIPSGDSDDSGTNHPYFADPDYMGVAPFGFAYPVGWYGDYGNWNDNNRGNNDGGHGGGGGGGGGGHGGR